MDDISGVAFSDDVEYVNEYFLEPREGNMPLFIKQGHEVDPWYVVENDHETVIRFEKLSKFGDSGLPLHEVKNLPFGGDHAFGGQTLFVDFADHLGSEALASIFVVYFVNLNERWLT